MIERKWRHKVRGKERHDRQEGKEPEEGTGREEERKGEGRDESAHTRKHSVTETSTLTQV